MPEKNYCQRRAKYRERETADEGQIDFGKEAEQAMSMKEDKKDKEPRRHE